MNQARTTYQSDYTSFDWFQNNVIADVNEFCSSENVDECLKYISQEFSALGYPSIYCISSDCPYSENCDIVKFLNITYELLKSNNEHIQIQEDLRNRNQCMSSDLNALNKKNSLLKISVEQNERKLASTLEKERQLKEKCDQISQLLKTEKEETKRLATQLRQQKTAYQHDIRKYENNMNQIKTKLNQLLSDKNPNKKIASITTSHTLTRNTRQRGKWKTNSTAMTAVEDMYNSVVSTYENRSKDLYKELNSFRQCMQSVLLNVLETVSALEDEVDGKIYSTSEQFVLDEIKKESRDIHSFEEKFNYLLSILKESASKKSHEINKRLEDQVINLKLKVAEYQRILEIDKDSQEVCETQNMNKEGISKPLDEEFIKTEKMKIEAEKIVLLKSRDDVEKEKIQLSSQKVALFRLAIQQKVSPSSWHEALNTSPSISVITSPSESIRISSGNKSKSLSAPEQIGQSFRSLSPQWMFGGAVNAVFPEKSDNFLLKENVSATQSDICSPVIADISDSDLPSWAINRTEVQKIVTNDVQSVPLEENQNRSMEEIEVSTESSSEEIHQLRLKAAMLDIEQRRNNIS